MQLISEKDAPFAERLMSQSERRCFTLHELWCLREAAFKLTGSGSLRDTRFRRESGVIVSPFAGVEYRLYPGIPGCAAAAAAYAPADFPPGPERVDTRELQRA